VDAFTVPWGPLGLFWAFPPFALLRTLRKIVTDGATGIVLVPNWANQPWFPLFQDLQISDAVTLRPAPNLLLSPCKTRRHPLWPSLEMTAALLSGRPSPDVASNPPQ